MTQIFNEDGAVVPVTVVEAGPCQVTQVKTMAKDGYLAAQIGFMEKKKLLKPILGHLKGFKKFRYLKEFKIDEDQTIDKGQEITVKYFELGENIKVTGISKGKGFQGVVKRHGFKGSPASHGHKDQLRMPGSIGATDAARVFKGKRMAGRMGTDQVTVANLEIVKIDEEKNLLYIKGAVPGARNGLIMIRAEGELVAETPKAESAESAKAPKVENAKEENKSDEPTKPEEPKKEDKKVEDKLEDKEEAKN